MKKLRAILLVVACTFVVCCNAFCFPGFKKPRINPGNEETSPSQRSSDFFGRSRSSEAGKEMPTGMDMVVADGRKEQAVSWPWTRVLKGQWRGHELDVFSSARAAVAAVREGARVAVRLASNMVPAVVGKALARFFSGCWASRKWKDEGKAARGNPPTPSSPTETEAPAVEVDPAQDDSDVGDGGKGGGVGASDLDGVLLGEEGGREGVERERAPGSEKDLFGDDSSSSIDGGASSSSSSSSSSERTPYGELDTGSPARADEEPSTIAAVTSDAVAEDGQEGAREQEGAHGARGAADNGGVETRTQAVGVHDSLGDMSPGGGDEYALLADAAAADSTPVTAPVTAPATAAGSGSESSSSSSVGSLELSMPPSPAEVGNNGDGSGGGEAAVGMPPSAAATRQEESSGLGQQFLTSPDVEATGGASASSAVDGEGGESSDEGPTGESLDDREPSGSVSASGQWQPDDGGGEVCRMAAAGSTAEGGEGDGEEHAPAWAEAGLSVEPATQGEPETPELLTPTREELEAAFPNPPKAPTPILPDPRKMTAEQLEAAAGQIVPYGGQPAARRANIDFERLMRERIHFETATRVMNYEIVAHRSAEVRLSKELVLKRDMDGPIALGMSKELVLYEDMDGQIAPVGVVTMLVFLLVLTTVVLWVKLAKAQRLNSDLKRRSASQRTDYAALEKTTETLQSKLSQLHRNAMLKDHRRCQRMSKREKARAEETRELIRQLRAHAKEKLFEERRRNQAKDYRRGYRLLNREAAHHKRLEEAQQALADAQTVVSVLRERATTSDKKLAELQELLQAETTKLREAEAALAESGAAKVKVEQQLEAQQSEVVKVAMDNEELGKTLHALREQLEKGQEEYADFRVEGDRKLAAAAEELRREKASRTEEAQRFERELAKARQEVDKLRGELQSKRREVADMGRRLHETEAKLEVVDKAKATLESGMAAGGPELECRTSRGDAAVRNEAKLESQQYVDLLPPSSTAQAATPSPSTTGGEASRSPMNVTVTTAAGPQLPRNPGAGAAGSAPGLKGGGRHASSRAGGRRALRAVGASGGGGVGVGRGGGGGGGGFRSSIFQQAISAAASQAPGLPSGGGSSHQRRTTMESTARRQRSAGSGSQGSESGDGGRQNRKQGGPNHAPRQQQDQRRPSGHGCANVQTRGNDVHQASNPAPQPPVGRGQRGANAGGRCRRNRAPFQGGTSTDDCHQK